jgi:hypothetical protein
MAGVEATDEKALELSKADELEAKRNRKVSG